MKHATRILGAAFLTALLAACGGGSGGGDAPTTPTTATTGTISGRVLDTVTGAAINAASVQVGTLQTTTNTSGNFTIAAVPPGPRTLVQMTVPGYETATRVESVVAGLNTVVTILALPIGNTGTVTPAAGGSVTIPGSPARVTFPAGALNASSPVTVTLTDVNPGSSPANMPGDFTTMVGTSERLIESFGALSVNLFNDAGQPVALGAGQTATVRIPVSTRSPTTPATIPLFYFDEGTGRWVQEGTATLMTENGQSFYEGTVSHFSYWNADQIEETVTITGCVEDGAGLRVADVYVESNGINYTGTSSVRSNAQGLFTIPVRAQSQLTLIGALGARLTSTREVQSTTVNADITNDCLKLGSINSEGFSVRLSWGQDPSDLDSWLLRPEGGHISFTDTGSITQAPFANLDVDDTSSFGPEVTTVLRPRVGTYRFFVNNFSGSPAPGITPSPTRVELTANGITQVFVPPAGETVDTMNWTVFDIAIAANCTATVTVPATRWTVTDPDRPAPADSAIPFCSTGG